MKSNKLIHILILYVLIFSRVVHAQQWAVVPSPSPSSLGNFLYGVYPVSESEVWAVGYYDTLVSAQTYLRTLTEKWNGTSWNVIPSPNPANSQYNNLTAIKGISSNDIYAIGYTAGIPAVSQMLILHWNGSAWSIQPTPIITGGAELDGICILSANDIWAAGDKDIGAPGPDVGTLILHRNGSGWDTVPSPNVGNRTNSLRGIAAVSSGNIWAVGYYRFIGGVYQTLILHLNGSSWSVVPSPNTGLESFLYSVSVVSANDIWASGKYNNNGTYAPLFMHWNGSSWTIVSSPAGGQSTVTFSSNDGWSVGGSIARWNGTSWSSVPAPIPQDGALYSLGTLTSSSMWAVGTFPSGGVAQTLVMQFGSVTGVTNENKNIPAEFALLQNYPNPFNPSTKIRFSIPQNSEVKLSVFDMSGKEVGLLQNGALTAGVYETDWHPVNLSSGIYFYTLKTNGFTDTKKMILIK